MKLIILVCLLICIQQSYSRNIQAQAVEPPSKVSKNFTKTIYYVAYEPGVDVEITDVSNNCEEKICIKKCCPLGFLFTIQERKRSQCVPIGLYNETNWKPDDFEDDKDILFITGFPFFDITHKRPKNITCETYEESEVELDNEGIYHCDMRHKFERELYCMDKAIKNGSIGVYARICHQNPESVPYHNQNISKILIWIPITLSFLFLIVIFFLHFISRQSPDLQKKCTISSCVSLFFAFLNLLLSRVVAFVNEAGCTSVAIVGQYFFMSFYFWFSVMCYEISRIIRGTFKLRPINDMNEESTHRFYWYSLYSWGVPFLLCVFTVIMQVIPLEDFPVSIQPYVVKPGIGKGRCWFERGLPTFFYYVLFEIVLHFANGLNMFHAAYLLYKDQLKYHCCSKPQGRPELRTHVTANHVEAFKIQFFMFILYLIMLMVKALSQIITGNQFLRLMIVILTLHVAFLFLVIIQLSKNKDVAKFLEKFTNRASEIRSRILFASDFDSSGAEVTRL